MLLSVSEAVSSYGLAHLPRGPSSSSSFSSPSYTSPLTHSLPKPVSTIASKFHFSRLLLVCFMGSLCFSFSRALSLSVALLSHNLHLSSSSLSAHASLPLHPPVTLTHPPIPTAPSIQSCNDYLNTLSLSLSPSFGE